MKVFLVCVDDIIMAHDNLREIKELNKSLAKEFEIKDLDRLKYFLGIEMAYS